MTQNNRDKLSKFFHTLYEDKISDISEVRKDLESAGINIQRIEAAVSNLLDNAKKKEKLNWLTKAQETKSKIDSMFNEQSQKLKSKFQDVREFVQAIRTGQFGVSLQEKAGAFFRNQDLKQTSDSDLVSFVEDCQLLDAFSKNQEGCK